MPEEASYHSSGTFTVDTSKLRKTYQGLLKADPDLYLCKTFQAVVASGASRLDIHTNCQQIRLEWNVETSFEDLMQSLPTGSGHLALALQLAFARPDLKVLLGSGDRSCSWHRGEVRQEQDRQSGTRLVFTSSRWRPFTSWQWPEWKAFRTRLGFQPLQIRLNGVALPVGEPGGLATQARFSKESPAGAVGLNLLDYPAIYSSQGDESGRCVQYVNLNANVGLSNPYSLRTHFSDDVLVFVQDGLPVYRTNQWLGQVGIFMAVADNRLPSDASTVSLVRGPELEAAIARARLDAEHFLFELEERFPGEVNPQLSAALRAVRFLPR